MFTSYQIIIGASLIIILSYIINIISNKTNIPSVLMLILLGILIKLGLDFTGIAEIDLSMFLEIIGTIGLIMIVLEASLDLELRRDRIWLIIKAFLVAILGIGGTSILFAFVLQSVLSIDLFRALLFAIPLSVLSSAIIIPSVQNLKEKKKEFLIYESTFSDIIGIMFFYFLLASVNANNAQEVGLSVSLNVFGTIVISFILSYALIILFESLSSNIKLFLLIAVLVMIYAIGKTFHMSSLIMILIFGLVLNNKEIFFRGPFKKFLKEEQISTILADFKVITGETAFVVRTFFFVIFGFTISLMSLISIRVWIITLLVVVIIYSIRWVLLRVFMGKDIKPQVFIAPRGLITILLIFAIPKEYLVPEFEEGILLFTIIVTGGIMTWALIKDSKQETLHLETEQNKQAENIELEIEQTEPITDNTETEIKEENTNNEQEN